jgi:hypothetical protein
MFCRLKDCCKVVKYTNENYLSILTFLDKHGTFNHGKINIKTVFGLKPINPGGYLVLFHNDKFEYFSELEFNRLFEVIN